MAKYYSPLILKSKGSMGSQTDKKHTGILVNVTARVSSISGLLVVCKFSSSIFPNFIRSKTINWVAGTVIVYPKLR